MNTDVLQDNTPRYAKLAKPKERFDTTRNYDPYRIKPGALSYQISDNINKLAQPKRKLGSNTSNPSVKSAPANTGKQGNHKLINSNEQSRYVQESKKKKFLLDTYARIAAARNKRCSKRLHELAKPKNYARLETYEDFGYFEPIKKFGGKAPRSPL
ncbi:uncharacterized protein LOC143177295 [Calliopsis andreniformis]|uniref:uncharacterized protein LOC143177295 n=1 Tax=Calliopsis andreniformis TaxID=337506 RepID=UPI003FCE1D1F